jgi:hypothetical protein
MSQKISPEVAGTQRSDFYSPVSGANLRKMGILQVVCGDISKFRVRKFDKPPPGDIPSDAKSRNSRALLAFKEEILQVADWMADHSGFEPVSDIFLTRKVILAGHSLFYQPDCS